MTPLQRQNQLNVLSGSEKKQILFKSITSKFSHYKTTQRKDALIHWKHAVIEDPSLWLIDVPTLCNHFLKLMMDAESSIRSYLLEHYLQSSYLKAHIKGEWLQCSIIRKLFIAYFKMAMNHLSNDIKRDSVLFIIEWLTSFSEVFLPVLQDIMALLETALQSGQLQIFGKKNIINLIKVIFKACSLPTKQLSSATSTPLGHKAIAWNVGVCTNESRFTGYLTASLSSNSNAALTKELPQILHEQRQWKPLEKRVNEMKETSNLGKLELLNILAEIIKLFYPYTCR